jgi:hypothetical protein
MVGRFLCVVVNNIYEVTDLDPTALSRLTTLELRNNKLITTNGIGTLPNLQNLYLVRDSTNQFMGACAVKAPFTSKIVIVAADS